MKGQRFKQKIEDKMTKEEIPYKEYDINKKPLHIYCISDTHIGSNVFNKEYFEYALNLIKRNNLHNKCINYFIFLFRKHSIFQNYQDIHLIYYFELTPIHF